MDESNQITVLDNLITGDLKNIEKYIEFSNFKFITIIANCFISFVLSSKIRKIIPYINNLKF